MASHYEILGVGATATAPEIEKAYRALVRKFHPDFNPSDPQTAARRFKIIQGAYETIGDAGRRAEYDQKCAAKLDDSWQPLAGCNVPGVRFNSDGSIQIGKHLIAPQKGIRSTSYGNAVLEKDAGPHGQFRIIVKDQVHRFCYAGSQWYTKVPGLSGSGDEGPKEVTSAPKHVADLIGPVTARAEQSRPKAEQPRPKAEQPTSAPPESAPRSESANSPKKRFLQPLVIGLALLFLGVAGGYFASRAGSDKLVLSPDDLLKEKEAELVRREALLEADRKLAEQSAKEAEHAHQLTLIRDRLSEIKRHGEDTLKRVESLAAEIDLWEKEIPPLLSNESGRRLAANPDDVRVVQAILQKPRPVKSQSDAIRSEVDALIQPIATALAEAKPSFNPGNQITSRLDEKVKQVEALLAQVRTNRLSIKNLVASRQRATPAPLTLAATMEALERADTEAEAETMKVVQRETRESHLKELADAKRKVAQAEADQEISETLRAEEAAREKLQHDKDLTEAKSRKVQDAVRYFTTPGYYYPISATNAQKGVDLKPFSLATIQAMGALEPTEDGLFALLFMLTHYPADDPRPKWGVGGYLRDLRPHEMEKLKYTQDCLRRLGYVLVELKQLEE